MRLPYFEKEILENERINMGPFIGYISPNGRLIDYSLLEGKRGHDNWTNPVTHLFLKYVTYVVLGESLESYKNSDLEVKKMMYERNKYEGFDDFVLRGLGGGNHYNDNSTDYDTFIKDLDSTVQRYRTTSSRDEWSELEKSLMYFFEKCYSKRDFFYSLGMVLYVHGQNTVLEKMYKTLLTDFSYHGKEAFYFDYCKITLMAYFKDIMVRYLGYDSIERALPEDDLNIYNNLYEPSGGYTYSSLRPIITTSCIHPNERFYEWIKNGWRIQVLPRMIWSTREQRFVESQVNFFHESDEEERLASDLSYLSEDQTQSVKKFFLR